MICITRWVVLDPSHLLTFDIVNKQLIIRSITDVRKRKFDSMALGVGNLKIVQGDPNQNLKFVLAITLKISISDPM